MAAVGIVVAVAGIGSRVPTWVRLARLDDPDPKVRVAAARALGSRFNHAATDRIRSLITEDPDPAVRDAAAYAARKLNDDAAIEPIQKTVLELADEPVAADLLMSLARLSGPRREDVAAFVDQCAASEAPYLAIGAAVARAEWFEARGVDDLLRLAPLVPEAARPVLFERLARYVMPVVVLTGGSLDLSEPWVPARSEALRQWWRQHGSDQRLADVLELKRHGDRDRQEIDRLEHARGRMAGVLGL
ncbi:MAG: HEAT repeat domain-containing protein [Phycisphaerae bacterium]|nr:HEAT repeat domain-containing protein [Phycisphaerae bacterium]